MMLDIPPHIEKFLSSQEMEYSEMQENLLRLGKKLHKTFDANSDDQISAWMAHYLAEKMEIMDSATGEAKSAARRECFETILMLWEYRASFAYEMRPFKNFEPVFRALAHIDPNKQTPSFFSNKNHDQQPPNEIEQAIKFITTLDSATRIMISYFVRESMLHATDESSLEWLSAISGIAKPDETRILLTVIPRLDKTMPTQDPKEKRKGELVKHIDRLELFESLSRDVKSRLKAELKELEAEN